MLIFIVNINNVRIHSAFYLNAQKLQILAYLCSATKTSNGMTSCAGRLGILIFTLAIFVNTASAQKYSNEFLSIGIGGAAQAMGNAVVASTQDVYAGYWNPAGLAAMDDAAGPQLAAMHAEWFGGVAKYDYLGASLAGNKPGHRLGISLIRFGIDQIPNTLSLYESDGTVNFDNLVEFSAADYAFIGSYARKMGKSDRGIRLGGNVKVIHRRIGPFATSWGFGLDLGIQADRGKWSFGAVARDITNTFNAWSFQFTEAEKETLSLTDNELPINSLELTKPQLLLGAARTFTLAKWQLRTETNLLITTDGKRNTLLSADPISIDPSLGAEASLRNLLFVRAGVNQFQRISNFGDDQSWRFRPGLGIGLKLGKLLLDYAYTDIGSDRNTFSHIISLRLSL